jgi:hypothetical protein
VKGIGAEVWRVPKASHAGTASNRCRTVIEFFYDELSRDKVRFINENASVTIPMRFFI